MKDLDIPVYDLSSIEREARLMRAEVARAGVRRVWSLLRKPRGLASGTGQTA